MGGANKENFLVMDIHLIKQNQRHACRWSIQCKQNRNQQTQ